MRDAILPKGAFKSPAIFEIASLNVGNEANLSISELRDALHQPINLLLLGFRSTLNIF